MITTLVHTATTTTVGSPLVNMAIFLAFVAGTMVIVIRASKSNTSATDYYTLKGEGEEGEDGDGFDFDEDGPDAGDEDEEEGEFTFEAEETEADDEEGDADESDDCAMYVGCLCPECNGMFCVDAGDDGERLLICPHCGAKVTGVPMDFENVPMAKPAPEEPEKT